MATKPYPKNKMSEIHPDKARLVDAVELVEECVAAAQQSYSEQWDAIDEDVEFVLDLEHYEVSRSRTRDRRRVEPRTLALFNIVRHKTAEIMAEQTHIDCMPVDDMGDGEPADWARFALEKVIHDPCKRYRARKRTMVTGGLAARVWGMAVDYDSRTRDLYFRNVDPTQFAIAPGWNDLHDPTCPWVYEDTDWRLQDVQAMDGEDGWKNTDKVKGSSRSSTTAPRRGQRNTDSSGRTTLPGSTEGEGDGAGRWVRVVKLWLRFDDSTETRSSTLALPPEEWYWACPECGQDYSIQEVGLPAMPEPGVEAPTGCPNCGGMMTFIDMVEEQEVYESYPKGRLLIVAPDEGVCLYDGAWPFDTRSFPYWMFGCYENPRRWIGQGDGSAHWTLQVLDDALMRFGFEQMIRNTDVIMTPLDGLKNSKGQPFRFTDEAGAIAYFSNPMAAQTTKHFQGSGLPPAWGLLKQSVDNSITVNAGTSALGMTQSQSRNIAVGTMEQFVRQGSLVTEDHKDRMREDEGIFLGCALDMIIGGAWSEAKWVRTLGPKGKHVMRLLDGASIPQMDVMVSATARQFNLKKEDFELFQQWLQMGTMDPAAQMVMAEQLNISPRLIQKYRQYQAMFQEALTEGPGDGQGDAKGEAGGGKPPAATGPVGGVAQGDAG